MTQKTEEKHEPDASCDAAEPSTDDDDPDGPVLVNAELGRLVRAGRVVL